MQKVVNQNTQYRVEIEATAHAWRMPFVWLMEKLFRAGDAVRLGKTTLFVKDASGNVIHLEYYGKSRKAAWYRQLEIEQQMRQLPPDEFVAWLKEGRHHP